MTTHKTKSKNRFGVPDVVRMAHEMNEALGGMWVQNIYTTAEDASKTFIFKLTSSHSAEGKVNLVMESGVRFHTTDYEREKSTFPSPFAMKLRKHIRERRLLHVRQIGMDRVVDFCFGKGDHVFHVILELYASGNIILTDGEGKILSLLRVYSVEETSAKNAVNNNDGAEIDKRRVAVGEVYPLSEDSITSSSVSLRILASLGNLPEQEISSTEPTAFQEELVRDLSAHLLALAKPGPSTPSSTLASTAGAENSKGKKKPGAAPSSASGIKASPSPPPPPLPSLVTALTMKGSPYQAFGPQLVEECLLRMGIDHNSNESIARFTSTTTGGEEEEGKKKKKTELLTLISSLNPLLKTMMNELVHVGNGYLIQHTSTGFLESFEPLIPYKFRDDQAQSSDVNLHDKTITTFPTFSKAVDEYFSRLEYQRWERAKQSTTSAAMSKVEAIRKAQEERVGDLLQAVSTKEQLSRALLANVTIVDQAIAAVNSLVAQGMKWEDVAAVVQSEKMKGNHVAAIIRALHLERNAMSIALPELPPKETVEVDLSLSAYANASNLFAEKKAAAKKAEVTTAKAAEVIKTLAAKAEKTLEKTNAGATAAKIRQAQKQHWFEKFHWFATSEGVLVIAGRDAQQNELIVKRYLRERDAYMHADMHGAPSCVVRNPSRTRTLPESSLEQAALFCVCKSPAWAAKAIPAAWWVHASQVSKTAPTGEYLPTGSFMVRGKKNYVQPSRLEMGFGYLFKVDLTACSETSKAAKEKEWRYLREVLEENKSAPASIATASSSSPPSAGDVEEISIVGTLPVIPTLEKVKQARKTGGDNNKSNEKRADEATTKSSKPVSATASSKHSKRKKKAEKKYKDQDEEERRLRLIALGYKIPPVKSEPSPPKKTEEEDVESEEDDDDEEVNEVVSGAEAVVSGATATETAGRSDRDGEDADEDNDNRDENENKDERAQDEMEEEGEDEEEREKSAEAETQTGGNEEETLLGYTASPAADDVILQAMPFCGPMASMSHFKFRAKLVPGTLKKSKAAKQATALFALKATAREREAMLSLGEPQVIAVMLGEVKVSAAGIEGIKAKARAKKGGGGKPGLGSGEAATLDGEGEEETEA